MFWRAVEKPCINGPQQRAAQAAGSARGTKRYSGHLWYKVLRNATVRTTAPSARVPTGIYAFSDGRFGTTRRRFLAPRAGFEPATIRLTVECSTAELPRNRRNNRSRAGSV